MTIRNTGIGSLGACRGLIHAFRAGAANCLLTAVLLAATPLQVMAQTQGVSITVSPSPYAGVGYPTIKEGETATFTVKRTGDNSNALIVNYSITSGGGPANHAAEQARVGDYTSTIPASFEFRAGESASHVFAVTAVDEVTNYEPNEYFTVTASGTYVDGDNTHSFNEKVVVRITENDERYLTLSPVTDSALGMSHPEFMAKEGATGNENQLKISLNDTLPYDLDIFYSVGDDPHTTAAISDDFKMAGGKLTLPDGQTLVTIDIDIIDDILVEPTEYFTLNFGTIKKGGNLGNALGTFNSINFQDSKIAGGSKLSVSIMDNDTAEMRGVVHLRGEGGGGIPGFPNTRETLTEGQSKTITAEIAGAAPTSDIHIPLKFVHFPIGEATPADHSDPGPITIKAGEKTGSVTLTITDDDVDERYRELLVVEIDDAMNFPTGYTKGDRSKYEIIMLDNDRTGTKLQELSAGVLSEDSGKRMATFEIEMDRLPKKDMPDGAPFSGVDVAEGDPEFKLEYSGEPKQATRGDDYMSPINVRSNGCSTAENKLTCTVNFTVKDDELYEGGSSGKAENVSIKLKGADWTNSDGITNTGSDLNLTIEDNDDQPKLSVGEATAIEGDKLAFKVRRTGARDNTLSVRAATAAAGNGANHAANSDYAAHSGTLEFRKGQMMETFEVTTTQDVIHEMDETLLVKLSMAKDTGGEPPPAIADDTGIGTITDNDAAPTELTIKVDTDTDTDGNQDTIAEAAGQTTVSVTATIDSPTRFATDQTVTVTVGNADNDDEASEGEGGDYKTVEQFTIIIPATMASGNGSFKLTPFNDRIDDDGEKISVEGRLGDMTVTHDAITIEDDDTRGITVSKATLTINEADDPSTNSIEENEGTYEVALASQPEGGTVTINITNPGPTVATAEPSNLMFTADNWEMAQTVTVIAKDDTIDDTGDQKTTTITHMVSAADTDYEDETAKNVEVTVLDNDEAPTALTITVDTDTSTEGDQDTISEGDEAPTVQITATLYGDTQFATDKTITITVGDAEDTATEGTGGDYATVDDFDITLLAGMPSVSHDLTLTLNDKDVVDEPVETVTVTGELAGVMVAGTNFSIQDDDDTPTVTLVLTPALINESGATNASTVTATMDGISSEAVTLEVSAMPVDPAVAGDLTLSENTTLEIPALSQASTGVVIITAIDNDVDAADKTVTIAATATGGNALVKAPGDETLTIEDDDTRGITVSKATLTLDEEDNAGSMDAVEHQGTYTVVLDSEPSGGMVTVGVASEDTTIAGVAPATLAFTASTWDEPQTVTVTAVADRIDNPNDRRTAAISHTVIATGTDYEGATASGVEVTVNDDDGAPTLSINSPSVIEADSGATSTLAFTVKLAPHSGNTVTVAYADTGTGTATSGGTDYETLAGGTLTFVPGDTSKSVAVTVTGDDIDEPDETVVVRLSSPSNATLTGGATTLDGTGTINDNDPTPTVSVADATAVSEGNVAAPDPPNNMSFAVTLSAASGQIVTVPYTLSGTATAGTDYTEPDPRSVTIAAGTTQANIAIPVAGDEVDEENETITVTLGTPTNATVSTEEGAGAASGTITDDDTRGVSVTPTELTVAEADNTGTAATREDQGTYKVVLTSQPTGAVTVNLNSGDESVARIDTASLVFDADDWNTEHTVTVTGQADVIDNKDDIREVDISHTVSAAGTDYADETAEGVTVTVTDDDSAPSGITLTANPDSVTENGGAKTITVTAAVNGATRYAQARTVSVSVGGGSAISGTDYTTVESFDITIGVGEDDASNTFTLTPENDVLAEGSETIDVTGTTPSGVTITSDEMTITDDDAAPSGITLSVDTNGATAGTPSTVAEDAGATVVTVTATVNGSTRYVDAKTVTVSVGGGTATSATDYAAVTNFDITIAAGAASQDGSFTVTPVDDDLDEANETINVTGTLTDITITPATVTLTDDDDPVSFSIADAEATEGGKVTFTVSREGAEDNVASVKVATGADSGDGVNAADADDYTAIATAQTLNFAAGVTSQTVEVQTTQDDLFEQDETFKAVLSDPALAGGDPGTGVSIESGKGTATGTISNDDTEPSFAVADASAAEGDAITFTVTRSGAMDNAVSVKWNTKADTGANAAAATDYTEMTTATKLDFAKGVGTRTFTVATTEDVLDEENETFLVELTGAEGGTISTARATGTITDDDAAPSGITLSVDTNGATAGTPSTVAEDAGATVVTVTATVNGSTRYVDAKTVTVSVGGGTATSATDYAAVTNFDITIAAGAASQDGSFTVTPVDDDLDEANETINVTGTLTDITITPATVTLTDDDDPVSFSIADAEATEGGKVTFTVSREGAEDNVASVKVATGADSGDGVNAADADDYTAIATAQTLNFAAGVTSQTVEVQTTQDDLFEQDETFKAVLSDPALAGGDPGTGVSIESGKGTATGTISNDDTEPSFAVADASAAEGDAITFTVTRSGAMDNAVSVKWNTKADTGANAAAATDYTEMTTATKLDFAKGVGTRTFTVATTEDVLDEENETFLVELTGAEGGTISTARATGTITDDDAAPSGITLSVDTNGATAGTPSTVAEDAGATVVTVTATVNGSTRYVDAKTVTVSVGGGTATSATDYAAVTNFDITIAAGAASQDGSFTVTPVDDDLDEANETINVTGTLTDITITPATVTLTDDDDPVSFSIADAEATEGGKVTFTVSREGAEDNVASVKVATGADSGDGVNAADADDYTAIATAQTLNFAAGVTSQTVEVQTTQDDLFEQDETFKAVLSDPALAGGDPGTGVSIESGKGTATGTISNDDTEPSFAVADASAAEGDAITFTVTRSGAMDNAVSVKWNTKADTGANAAAATDYTEMTTATKLDFAKGVGTRTFTVATTEDVLDEENETFLVELTGAEGGTISTARATGTITDDDAAPSGITLSVDTNGATAGTPSTVAEDAGATVVTVTATVNGSTRYVDAKTVTVSVGGGTATSATDYAAVTNFDITIAAGAASQDGSFTVTPVDDDLDEANETINVTGTLTDITITPATVTLTDDDDPVSFSIADAEATEGGKVTFTVSREGAEDNVASVKVATGADSGDGVNAADADDYTAIATAQTLNFAAGVTSQTVEVQTTQDDLFEQDETFKAVLSDPALAGGDPGTGVSIESGKGTATGTISNDDTEPSFAVADASAAEGDAITFTVTRSGAMDNAVSVKWNTKADTGANAAAATDYTEMTTATKLDFAKGVGTRTFTVATTEDVLDEENETFLVELTGAEGGTISTARATGTITDDDAAPSGITLSVDTNGATAGTPSTVAEDAGATVVTVTATVNGSTRYVDAKTVTVSVGGGTATSATDYAAVTNFDITIAAGAASQDGSFTVTPVDDDLDEANETINVTGTLTDITITPATVTLTDDDDPVSFSIADAEATEGGKVTFTVSREGAEDNVASVKVATGADSGDGVNAADADDYTAIATAQTLNFAAGVTSQTVEVQTTQDDLFEQDETFKAVLSDPALAGGDPGTGVSIESGKGTATGTISNDDTEPSFAVADASAAEGDAITFTVTRSGAMDNAVSVKWNTKADTGANAAAATDYTEMTTATKLDFAKGVGTRTFTVATTEDVLDEENETFLVELTGAEGGTISTARATGTITDDDAAPSGITLSVDTNGATAGTPSTVAEDAGATVVTVTATVNGSTRYVDAKTVTVSVGGGTATSATDYAAVTNFDITIAAGAASQDGSFTVTPVDDDLHEGAEDIDVTGRSGSLTIIKATLTINDDDGQPSFAVADASAAEGDAITFTVTRSGAMDNAVSVKWNTKPATGASAASASDYTEMTTATKLDFAKGVGTRTFTVATTEDTLNEANETFLVELTEPVGGTISTAEATGTITDDDAAPTTLTLAVDADNDTQNVQTSLAENGGAKTVKVTATLGGATQFDEDKTLTLIVGDDDDDSATEGTDYADVADVTLTITASEQEVEHTFTLTPTDDAFHEGSETISFDATLASVTVTGASITLTSDDAAPAITLTVDADKDTDNMQTSLAEDGGAKTVRATATLDGTTRLEAAADLTLAVGKDTDSAVEGTDYTTVDDRTITIGAGVASVIHDFTLTPTDDDIDEPNEGISIEGTLTGITVAGTAITLTDDEVTPTVTLELDPATIDERGDDNASTVTAMLSGKSNEAVTLTVAAAAGANTASGDFTLSGTTLTIAAGATTSTGTVTITAVDNDVDAPNKSVTVSATASGGGVANPTDQTLTITDDEGVPTASLVLTPTDIDERGDDNASTVTAMLSGKSNEAVTLTVAAAAGANTASGDFTLSGTTLTIAAGATTSTGTVTITAVDNDVDAPNKSVTVSATASGGGVANPTDQTLTITDDEGVPTASLVLTPTDIDERGDDNASTVTAMLSGKSNEAVTLTVAAAAGANTASGDFTLSGTTLTIAAGATTSTGTVTITAVDNDVDAPNKSVTVSATASGGGVANPTDQTLTITDDEGVPTASLVLTPTDIDERGDDNASTVTAMLSGKSNEAVTLTVAAAAGANTASGDFTLSGTTLTIAAGATTSTGTVTITAVDNDVDAPNKSVTVSATASGGGVANPTDQTLTITDDEGVPTASLVLTPTDIDERGDDNASTVTAMLSGKSNEAVTLTVAAAAGANTASGDFTLSGTTLTIAAGATTSTGTVTITAVDNDVDAPNKSVTVSATASGGGVANPTDQTLTITDDEGVPTASLVLTPTDIDERGDDNASTVTAMLSGKSNEAVTLTVAAAAGANTASGDFTLSGTTLTIAAGATTSTGTVTITAVDNDVDAPNKSVTVSATASGGGVANPTDQTLTITDDEGVPTASLVLTPTDIDERGDDNASTVTAMLSGKSNEAVTLTVAAAAGANTASGDFTLSGTTLTIAAGATTSTGTVTITAVDNDVDAPNKSVTVSATASGGGVANPTDQTLTITDDEGVPTASLVLTPTDIDERGDDNASTVTAMLSGKSNEAVTLTVAAAAGANTASGDFTLSGTTLTIAAGATTSTGTVTITAVDNDVDAPNKSVTVSATASGGGVANPTDQTLTITDDEGVPTASLVLTPTDIDERGDDNASTVTAMLSGKSNEAVTLTVAAAAGANTASGDFTLSGTTLTIAAGATTSTGTVTITAVDNDVDAPNKSVTVSATASGGGVANPTDQTLTITDDEGVPTASLVLTPTDIDERGDDNASTVTAMLSGKSNEAVTLTVAAAAGANTASGDFTLSGTTLTIAAGATTSTGTVTITAVDNDVDAPNKSVTVSATASGGGVANPTDQTLTITDDEGVPTASLVLTPTDIDERGDDNASTVTAMLSGKSNEAVTLTVAAAAGANTASGDFTLSGTTLTIAAGATTSTGTVTITAVDNDVDAPNKSVTVSATASGGGVANPTDQTLTITDDEGVPTASLVLTPTDIDERGDDNASTVTAMLSGKSNEAVTLTVAAAAGANTASGDFTLSGTTLTIAAGATTSTGTVTITAVDNDVDAPNKSVTVSATASGGGVANPTDQTLTITDDEGVPTASLVLTPTDIDERGDDNASTVTAMLSGKSNEAVTLTVAAAAGANTASGDFTLSGTTLTIAAGATTSTGTVTITAVDNDVDAPNKSVTVSATASGGGVANPTDQTLTITDDDAVPTGITLTVLPVTVGEGAGETEITVTATVNGSTRYEDAKTVTVSVGGGTAISGTDYDAVSDFDITIAAGAASKTGTFDLTPTDDVLHEEDETIDVTGASGSLTITKASITITDDDAEPSFAVADASASEGDAIIFTVTRSGAMDNAVSVKWNTKPATGPGAASATDYTPVTTARTLTFAKGVSSQTFTVATTEDDLHEGDETFLVELTDAIGGTITTAEATGTITDDEVTPTVTLVLTPGTINESGNGNASTVTATLTGKSSAAVTLTVAAAAGAHTVAGDFTLSANKTLMIAAGATTSTGTVTITAVDNDVDAPNKSVTVSATASAIGGVSDVAKPDSQILTITDDDDVAPTVTLMLAPTTINESGSTNSSTVTATLTGKSSAAVTLTVAAAAGAHTVAGDFTLSANKTLMIAAGATTSTGTVTITAVDNDVDAPNKSVTVSATASGGGVADPGNQTLTITDDDVAPTGITLSVSPATVGEGDDETEITVTATVNGTTRYVDAKTVTVSVGGGDAISGTDYTAVPSFDIIIAAGEASKAGTFDLTPTDDVVHEGTEMIDVTGASGSLTITKASITLTDDDTAPMAMTLSVDADMGTPGIQTSLAEDGGAKKVRVTAMLGGSSTFTEAKTVTLEVGADADSATEGTDYAEVERQSININAGAESGYVEFTLTPTQDVLHEGSEAISLDGTLTGVTVTDSKIMLNDDDGAPTALTLSVDADTGTDGTQTTIAEDGGAKTVRVTATITGETRFVETKTVTVEVGADADSATEGTDYAEVMRRSVTINAGAASGYEEFTLTPTDDTRHEGSETISLEGTLTDVAVTGTSLTITDEEDTPTVTLMLAPTTISESGSTNTSTVTATLSGESSSAVTVTVAAAAGAGTAAGDFTVSTNKTLTIAAGATTSTGAVTITAVDNDVDAPNKSVTVSATASGGGVTSPADQTLVITDDDAAPTGITLSVSPATVGEGDGKTEITVTAMVNGSTRYVDAKTVTVSVGGGTAISGTDYAAVPSFDITIAAGDASKAGTFDLEPTDDALHEENETIDVTGSSGVLDITKALITIADNDDRSDPMLAAWLGRFGRGVAEQALDGIAGRIAASRSAGMQGTVAGKALALDNPGPIPGNVGAGRSFGYAARSDTTIAFDADSSSNPSNPVAMTAREVLLGSSFTATGETATGGSLALWGRTAQSSFDGQDGDFSLDGETTSAMLGADYARDGWLLGLALMQSSGKGGYSDSQARPCPAGTAGQSPCSEAVRTGGGTVKATMTAVLPYASLQVSERLRLWGALGHGSGEVTLRPEPGGTLSADISWSMAATGLRGDVITAGQGSNFSLAFTSDMLWSRTRSEKTHELAASSATVTRLRAGLEAGWQMPLEHGSWLMPRLEIGARHDGGDAETGLGVELGGGLAWTDPGRGLSLDLSARSLIVHDDDDIKDQGFAAAFNFDPQPDSARGLSLSLRQDAGGQPEGGLYALFTPEPLSARSGASGSSRSAEAAYGLPALSGRFTFTPHVGLSMAEESRDFRFGWRLTPEATAAPDLSIGLVATRRESAAARPVHGVGLGMTVRW